MKSKTQISEAVNYKGFLFDLIIYITVMFLIRKVYFQEVGFITNGLFWSFTTLVIAMWRMKVRNVTWKELGLRKPDNIVKTLGVSALILATTMISLVAFNILIDYLPFSLGADTSSESAVSKFGNLKGNWVHFF